MTPEQISKLQRDYLILTEKQSAYQLASEFDDLRREITDFLLADLSGQNKLETLYEKKLLGTVLDRLSSFFDNLSGSASSIVERAQKRVINFAANSLKKFLPELSSSIFEPDKPAIRVLIGRTQTGEPLKKLFASMKPAIAEKTKETLIEGFSLGESNQQIARRINNVSGLGYSRALTISRTETNESYRAASRIYIRDAGIQEYVWMAVLDVRTCVICWHLHGQKFTSSKKVFSHPNCRCCLIGVTKNMKPVKTGAELFNNLETGFQKQILGAKRFELFEAKKFGLNDFVGSKETGEYGKSHFIKSLDKLTETKFFPMAVQESRRGTTFLTNKEFAQAKNYAVKLGMPENKIYRREDMNTSWGVMFGKEMLNVGPDALPVLRLSGRTLPPNSYISLKGGIAHEVIGHRQAYLAGKMQESPILEEVQASLRAAVLAPNLTVSERRMLIRDARFRLLKYDIIYKEVKDLLWLEMFQQ